MIIQNILELKAKLRLSKLIFFFEPLVLRAYFM